MDKEIVGYSKGKVDFWDDIQDVMSCKYLYQGSSAWEAWAGQWAVVDWKLAERIVISGTELEACD